MKNLLATTQALVLTLALAGLASAQDDTALVTQVVPPNVMILFDDSGSMSNSVWSDAFDPLVFHDIGGLAAANCDINAVTAVAGSDGICPASGDGLGRCPSGGSNTGGSVLCTATAVPGGCAAAPLDWGCSVSGTDLRFNRPNYTPSGTSRWSRNYQHWIFNQVLAGATPIIPRADRMETARAAVGTLISNINPAGFPERMRFGLATFGPNNDPAGASLDVLITDGNTAAVTGAITTLTPGGNTPLAESLAEIGQYMTGDASVSDCSASSSIAAGNPMQDYCRRNFVIILTDGVPTRDDFDHMNLADFTCAIGDADGDGEDPNGRTDAAPYTSEGTDWLDDVAFAFNQNDLRADLQDTQNIQTYTIGFAIDHPMLGDTAANGGGEYFVASDAASLVATLQGAFLDILAKTTSFTATTVPASRTSFADGFYRAFFVPDNGSFWQGHIQSYQLDASLEVLDKDGGPALDAGGLFVSECPFWDTALRLVDQSYSGSCPTLPSAGTAHPPRNIYTTSGGARQDFTKANIKAADLGLTDPEIPFYNGTFADREVLADEIVDYVYGFDSFDENADGDLDQKRDFILGDIFHSNPIIIGPPPFALANEQGFGPPTDPTTFLGVNKKRNRVLYVGANDGMLHGIDAGRVITPPGTNYDQGTGNELFGYIPETVKPNIKMLTRNFPRTFYYVDGSPTAADAWFPSGPGDTVKDPKEWTTVLVAGMRQGGDGYLALDVTDPGAGISDPHGPYPKFLWEFTGATEPLAEAWSEPVISRVRVRGPLLSGDKCGLDDGDGDCREQWVAIFAGGFNDTSDPNLPLYVDSTNPAFTSDSKAVFIVEIETGKVLGKLEYDPAGAPFDEMVYAAPSAPAVLDLDFDGFVDLIYVGDTGGQIWKWDVHYKGADTTGDPKIDNWPADIFFDAGGANTTAGFHYRSVFFPVTAAFIGGKLILAFGTGERTELSYAGEPTNDEENRFYKIEDPNPIGGSAFPASPYTEANLTDITGLNVDTDATDLGYFFKALQGEKFITNHLIFGGDVITASYQPDIASGDICNQQGNAFVHIFNLGSGAGFFDPANPSTSNNNRSLAIGLGVPSDPRIVSSGDNSQLFIQTSSGAVVKIDKGGGNQPLDKVYWKQDF